MMEFGSKEHARWLNEADNRQRRRRIDHAGFDLESFVDGYIECALWADCMPDDRCKHCDTGLDFDSERDVWVHVDTGSRNCWQASTMTAHVAKRDEDMESGGREHLELREGARERMIERGQLVEFVSDNLSDLLLARVGGATTIVAGVSEGDAGHDLWLTRSGHGTGFWDRGLGELGDRLTEAAKSYGSPDDHTPYDCGDGFADV